MTNTLALMIVGLCLALAGCQEDLGQSAAAAPDAYHAAEQREQQSLAALKQTLGGPTAVSAPVNQARSEAGPVATPPPQIGGSPPPRPTLSWTPPATREDGSRLAVGEIRGYRLYFRLRHQDRFESITLDGPDATRFSLASLPPGAYEFTVTTLDQAGLESRRSEPVSIDLI